MKNKTEFCECGMPLADCECSADWTYLGDPIIDDDPIPEPDHNGQFFIGVAD